ncbi:hypothetical protein H0R92_01680 [Treponema sp. OMZ 840]|uniref:hypothetical protein n=1 Tax=Treponema sp. OMZ 840 TaxID=244313 RepID=UPI003D8FE444
MKKLGFIFTAAFILLIAAPLCADAANDVKIDWKLDIAKENYAMNFFSWKAGDKAEVKDSFDAASGASLKGSTKAFNSVRYAEPAADKKAAIPGGLRGLFLFAVADWKFTQSHALQVTKKAGAITVRFIRKANAYELKTDKKGNFDLLTGSKCAKNIAEKTENGFVLKPEYVKAGGNAANMADLDWDKVKLENDTFNPEAAYRYEGTLQFTLKNNVLGISGTMIKK